MNTFTEEIELIRGRINKNIENLNNGFDEIKSLLAELESTKEESNTL